MGLSGSNFPLIQSIDQLEMPRSLWTVHPKVIHLSPQARPWSGISWVNSEFPVNYHLVNIQKAIENGHL